MMSISFKPGKLSEDEDVKRKAALTQMKDLLSFLEEGKKYSTLTISDRQMLLRKGYASDLIDNVIFFTERTSSKQDSQEADDKLVVGYTYSAFDPSMYACASIVQALQLSHMGKCAFCESQIDHISQGCVSHFRPAWGVIDDGEWQRNAYYQLAYDQKNLLLSCSDCRDVCKGNQFPIVGERSPNEDSEKESALLVNPYEDDPREYVRFNPLNGEAFAYDAFRLFCINFYSINENKIEHFMWQHPEYISKHIHSEPNTSKQAFSKEFSEWLSANDTNKIMAKGQVTIDVLGLNRPTLTRARLNHLSLLRGLFLSKSNEKLPEEKNSVNSYIEDLTSKETHSSTFRSASIDALNSWAIDRNKDQKIPWFEDYQQRLIKSIDVSPNELSPWFSSSLQYMVLETELELEGKRRIVHLHSSDFLYGSDRKAKTVFLTIDWKKDFNNVIKVSTGKLIWEASFSELANTQPIALQNLFANNEVWAEGNYPSLA